MKISQEKIHIIARAIECTPRAYLLIGIPSSVHAKIDDERMCRAVEQGAKVTDLAPCPFAQRAIDIAFLADWPEERWIRAYLRNAAAILSDGDARATISELLAKTERAK